MALLGGLSYAEAMKVNWESTGYYEGAGRDENSLTQTDTEADYWNPSNIWNRQQEFAQMQDQGYPGVTFFGPRQAVAQKVNADGKANVKVQT